MKRIRPAVHIAFVLVACAFALAPMARLEGQQPAPAVQMVSDTGEGAKYWGRWRGPSGQGVVAETGYPDSWSGTENVKWKVPVPGNGNSSPIVWGDHIFLTTAYDGGRRLSVVAFRRSDGVKQWETFAPDGRNSNYTHFKNGYASATPATDGQRVYASFGGRGLLAVDMMTGKQAWHRDLGPMDAYHGTAGSPLLYKDRLILYQDQSRNAFISAFDARTGKTLWTTPREADVGWGTPIAVHVVDHDEIIVNGQLKVQAYNPDTGAELWSCSGSTYEVIPTPVVGYGMVFCSSGRAGPTLAIRPGGKGDVTRTHLAWSSPRGSPFVPSPILYGEHLYMVNDMQSIVTSLEATSGKVMWQNRLGASRREGFSSSPVAVDGKVFFTNDEGETFVLKAGPTFELLRTNRIGEGTLATPALVDRRWYIRTERNLFAIGM